MHGFVRGRFLQARATASDAISPHRMRTSWSVAKQCSTRQRRVRQGDVFMLIKIGFDIELGVASPMALIYLLRVHPSRRDDLVAPEDFRINNDLVADEYIDS